MGREGKWFRHNGNMVPGFSTWFWKLYLCVSVSALFTPRSETCSFGWFTWAKPDLGQNSANYTQPTVSFHIVTHRVHTASAGSREG